MCVCEILGTQLSPGRKVRALQHAGRFDQTFQLGTPIHLFSNFQIKISARLDKLLAQDCCGWFQISVVEEQ